MSRISWPIALIVVALIGAIAIMGVFHADTGGIFTLVSIIISAGIFSEVQVIKNQTNGHTHRLMNIVEQTANQQTGPAAPPKEESQQ